MLRLCALLLITASVGACDIETSPTDGGIADNDRPDSSNDAVNRMFVEEYYGIGMNWFKYAKSTHALLPIPRVYRFEDGDATVLFEIESYYNERGDSGHFQIMRQVMGDGGEAALVAITSNVKDAPVCINLKDAIETPCDEARHDLVIRTDWREIAPAGFALSTPGFYVANHDSDPGAQDTHIYRADFDSLAAAAQAVDDGDAWTRYRDSNSHLSDAALYASFQDLAVGATTPAFFQASAQMKMIGWSMEKTAERAFNISTNCVKLRLTKDAQTLPLGADAQSTPLEFEADRITLVSLCGEAGPAIVEVATQPYRGMWPASDTYDLLVDTTGEAPQVRIPPGHLIMSSGAEEIDASVELPVSFWDNDDIG